MHTPHRPYSEIYSDHYWSKGAPEKTHVFINGNNLPVRLLNLAPNAVFTVAELGFGTGLNMLLTLYLWQVAPTTAHLNFISYEAHPIPLASLKAIHATLPPALHPAAQTLQAHYNPRPGWNHWPLTPKVTLSLYIGDVATGLPSHPTPANAWFLDGFSPALNPAMWTPEVLHHVATHTVPGGTATTYSVARAVRLGLMQEGFDVQKVRGHYPKEHMLQATKL